MNNALTNKYLSSVKKNLSCSSKKKSEFLSALKKGLDDFLLENPESTYEDIVKAFGMPEKQANEFMDSLDSETIKKAFSWKKAIAIGIIIVLIIWGIVAGFSIVDTYTTNRGYSVDYIDDIPDDAVPEGADSVTVEKG